jgi:5-methylcytosine-specific restriction protein A
MPWKPKRPCRHPGCKNLSDQAYCEVHRKGARAEVNRLYDQDRRDQEMSGFYHSAAWVRLRVLS